MIGLYGTIFFHSSSRGLVTFDAMKKTVTARWGDHPVHLSKPLLEYAGPQLIEITFRMELIKPFTVDPLATIVTLEEIMDLAIPLPLVIGMKPMGRGLSMFVLTGLSHEMKYFYRGGGLLGASVEVQLKEYPTPNLINSLMKALGGVFGQGGQAAPGAVGTDANASSIDPAVAATEKNAYDVSVDKTLPQLSQNWGNPTPMNIGTVQTPVQPPQPPQVSEAESVVQGD